LDALCVDDTMEVDNTCTVNGKKGKVTLTIPVVKANTEGRGNGIRTNITNMVEVSKKIKRNPAYTTKYFGTELGCQSTYDPVGEKATIQGEHHLPTLQEQLKKFIKAFVVCKHCSSIETKLTLNKKGDVYNKCSSCKEKSMVDMSHKVVKEIQKNPPGSEGEVDKKKKGKEQGKKNRRAGLKERDVLAEEAAEAEADGEGGEAGGAAALDEEELEARRQKKKEEKEAKKAAKKAKEATSPKAGDEGEGFGEDKASVVIDCAAIAAELREKIEADGLGPAGSWWGRQIDSAGYSLDEAMTCAFNGCFDVQILKQIKPMKSLFSKMAGAPHFGSSLLALVSALATRHPSVLAELGLVLKGFYDESLLEDDHVLEWWDELGDLEVKKQAAPFVTWVKTVPLEA